MTPEARQAADEAKGWLLACEGPELHRLGLEAGRLGPLVEIGGYCGKSACWLGAAAVEAGTVLFSIDHHRGSPEMAANRECHDPDVVDPVTGRHDTLWWFRRTIDQAGLEDHVVPLVASSDTVGRYWRTPVGLVFVDGGHDDKTVAEDVRTWWEFVVPGGLLVAHDTTIPGIAAAVSSLPGEVAQCGTLRAVRKTS